jgi:hypothetical protein
LQLTAILVAFQNTCTTTQALDTDKNVNNALSMVVSFEIHQEIAGFICCNSWNELRFVNQDGAQWQISRHMLRHKWWRHMQTKNMIPKIKWRKINLKFQWRVKWLWRMEISHYYETEQPKLGIEVMTLFYLFWSK